MATQQERIQELEKKNEALTELLQEALKGPRKIGTVSAGPEENYFRISSGESDVILPVSDLALSKKLELGSTVMVNDKFIVDILPKTLQKKEKLIDFNHLSWDEIGGMKSQIQRIREAVESPLNNPKLFKEFGIDPARGIMLYGPPGCGKTMIARAIATLTLNTVKKIKPESFIYVKGGEMLRGIVGAAETNIKNMFDSARAYQNDTGHRSVIFIDEAEAIMPRRGSRISSDVDTTIVPTFLAEMDGFEKHYPLVILATNHPSHIDEAIQRPGRIDMKVEITRPTQDDAYDIFKIYLGKTKVEGNVKDIAEQATKRIFSEERLVKQVSGALISNIVSTSARSVIMRKGKGVSVNDVEQSIQQL